MPRGSESATFTDSLLLSEPNVEVKLILVRQPCGNILSSASMLDDPREAGADWKLNRPTLRQLHQRRNCPWKEAHIIQQLLAR